MNRFKGIATTFTGPATVFLLFGLLSCGAKKASSPAAASPASPAGPAFTDHYVDTNQFAMHPNFKGWSGDTARALNNLRGQIDAILHGSQYRGGVVSACKVIMFDQNDAIHNVYSKDADVTVLPASTEKLFTSSSTLWALGSHYAFTTKLDLAQNASLQGSNVVGNLYLRPSGDPTLKSTDLDMLVDQLKQKGITTVQGDIISDIGGEEALSPEAKKYMAAHNLPIAPSHDSAVAISSDMADTAPASGSDTASSDEDEISEAGVLSVFPNFALDRNIVTVTVTGGSRGGPVTVRTNPPISSIVVQSSATASAGSTSSSRTVGKGRHKRTVVTRHAGTMTLRVSSSGQPMDPQQIVSVSGQIPAGQSRSYSFPIKNVPMAMAAVMKYKMQQAGIQVTGQPRVDRAPPNTALKNIAVKQTSLVDLLTQMNKRSDNYLAESMFRKLSTIATVAATAPDERARKLMRSWLQVCNVDGSVCTFIDGSGLSKSNRTNANTTINLLTAIKQQGLFELFTHTLSIAGYDGTLRHRMIGTPAQYNAHGKTGTLNAVTALAGYVVTGDGQLAAYFITMQKFRGGPWGFKKDQDKIVEALAGFKYSDYQSMSTIPNLGDTGALTK